MSRVLAGTLLRPDGAPVGGARIYLTAKRNEMNNVVQGVDAFFLTNSDGTYSQSIVNGYYSVSVEYTLSSAISARRWNLGDISVESGASISLNELLQFSAPPDSGVAGQMQEWYEAVMAAVPVVEAAKVSAQNSATAAAGSATTASNAATAASGSAGSASASANSAQNSATTATNAAATATGAANTATTKAGEASASATNAQNSATAAAASEASVAGVVADAEAARDAAITAKNEAQASADGAESSATAASGSATAADGSATDAAASASTASDAADTATDKAGEAQSSATAAAGSETAAAGSATAAAGSATDAADSASTASDAADTATDKAGEAQSSATAAAGSETAAAGSATAAAGSATDAAASASTASDAADIATDKASEAQSSATAAAGSETAAAGSATAASDSASQAGDSAAEAASEAGAAVTARNDAEGFSTAAAGSATAAAGSATKSQNFANMDEDVPVPDSGGLYSAKHWAAKAEEAAGGGITPVTVLDFLTAVQGGAFGPTSTLAEALQSIVNVGIGAVNTSDQTLDSLASFDDLWAVPRGKVFLATGGSTATTGLLTTLTAGTTYPYTVGNANTRDLFVKIGAMEYTVAGTTYRKMLFQYRGQGTVSTNSGLRRLLGITKNMTTSAVTGFTELLAESAAIPVSQTFTGNQASSWVAGKSSDIGNFNFRFSKASNTSNASMSGGVTLSSSLAANSRANLFFGVASADIIAVEAGAAFLRPYTNDTAFATTVAIFPLGDPTSAAASSAELVYEWYLDGGVTKVSVGIINRSASVLPASAYVFAGGFTTQ